MAYPNRPRTLFEFSLDTLTIERHCVTEHCLPACIGHAPYPERWRCRTEKHDHYGYALRKDAKESGRAQIKALQIKLARALNSLKEGQE